MAEGYRTAENAPHPIVMEAIACLKKNADGEMLFEGISVRRLEGSLAALFGSSELVAATTALVRFAFVMVKNGAIAASADLLNVALTAIEPLRALGDAPVDLVDALGVAARRGQKAGDQPTTARGLARGKDGSVRAKSGDGSSHLGNIPDVPAGLDVSTDDVEYSN